MANRVDLNEARIKQLLEGPGGDVARDLRERTLRVEAAAKQFAPVDTGRLRASISHDIGRDARGLYGRVGSDVIYARRVELGFVGVDSLGRKYNQAPQPYLRPGLIVGVTGDFPFTQTELGNRALFRERRELRFAARRESAKRLANIRRRLPATAKRLQKRGITVKF